MLKLRTCKWARFDVPLRNKSQLIVHKDSRIHSLAVASHLQLSVAEIARPLISPRLKPGRRGRFMRIGFPRGRPSVTDWIAMMSACWRMTSGLTFCSSASENKTLGDVKKSYTKGLFAKMLLVGNETLKLRAHRQILRSKDLAFFGDGKGVADVFQFGGVDWDTLESFEGMYGIENQYEGTLEELVSVKGSDRVLKTLQSGLGRFCTRGVVDLPRSYARYQPGQSTDIVKTHIMDSTGCIAFDGAPVVQKAGRDAAGSLFEKGDPLLVRDLMHEVDLCVENSMKEVKEVQELVETWITGPKSHAKQVTYSDTYKHHWMAAQEKHIERGASPLAKPLKSLSYSGVRKMSKADVMESIVYTAIPSVAVCAYQAQHAATKEDRASADKACRSWTPTGAILFGMIADLYKMAQGLKNQAEPTQLDASCSPMHAEEFLAKLHAMFTKSEVMNAGEGEHTLTQLIMDQLKSGKAFFVNDEVVSVGVSLTSDKKSEAAHVKAALQIMQRWVELIKAMLGICCQDGTTEYAVMCFNIWLWKDVWQKKAGPRKMKKEAQLLEDKLLKQHRQLCQARHWLERENSFLHLSKRAAEIFGSLDDDVKSDPAVGKICWRRAFMEMVKQDDKHVSDIERKKLSWFLGSYRRQTTTSERLLKVVATLWKRRGKTTDLQSVYHQTNLKFYGPQKLEDLVDEVDGGMVPKDFLIDCDAIWHDLFGNRHNVVTKKSKVVKRKMRDATKRAFQKRHRFAVASIAKLAVRIGRGNHASILGDGVKLKHLRPMVSNQTAWTDGQRQVVGRYAKSKKQRDDAQAKRLAASSNPHKKEADESAKKRVRIEAAAKKMANDKNKAKSTEKHVYCSVGCNDFEPSGRFERVKSIHSAEIVVCPNIARASNPVTMTCKITKKIVKVIAPEVAACKLLGLRLTTPDYFASDGKSQSVKFRQRWRTRKFGICFSDAFKLHHGGHVGLVRGVMVKDKAASKWWEITEGDVAKWKKDKSLAGNCKVVNDLKDYDEMVQMLAEVDVGQSDQCL